MKNAARILRITGSIAGFLLICMPAAMHASAVKQCRVEAVVKSVAGTGERPRLTILVKSSVFERGHSMGEDCNIFEIGLPGEERSIELEGPVATAPGRKILLLFVDVRNVGPNGPVMHQRWELHSDNGKNN